MSDTALSHERVRPDILRQLFPRHAAKLTAARFGIAFDTAKKWLTEGVPAARRAQLADAIEVELQRMERNVRRLREEAQQLRQGDDR